MEKFFFNTVNDELLAIINAVCTNNNFNEFALCGGTALALQLGHRVSIDADFICKEKIDSDYLLKKINETFPNAKDIFTGTYGVFLKQENIKLDFLSWNIANQFPIKTINEIRLLDVREIAAMKLFAILQRGEKKDYIDIAILLQQFELVDLISFYKLRYNDGDGALVIRFLSSYSDIENQPMPQMTEQITWQDCKEIIKSAIQNFINNNIA